MVIVYDLSRLTRWVRDMVDFVEDVVERYHIKLVSIRESIDTSTPSGKAFINIAAVFAQMYRDEIAYKTKAAMLHKQKHLTRIAIADRACYLPRPVFVLTFSVFRILAIFQ
jgi:site-specific DNA recombinase